MRISTRYIPHLSMVLAATLAPVIVHSYAGLQRDDCADATGIVPNSTKLPGVVDNDGLRETFSAVAGVQGTLETEMGVALSFTVVRSYDAKKLYHRPEIYLVPHVTPDNRTVEWMRNGPDSLPVHRAWYAPGESAMMAAYILAYRSTPVANPYLAQLSSFAPQLLGGRSPMTLYFISGRGPAGDLAKMEQAGREWLLASWKQYVRACLV